MQTNSVAILWDAENINPSSVKSLVDAVIEYAEQYGRVSVAFAYGDWTRKQLKDADELLARESFQLIHIPAARKNSADISMVTSGMELLFLYPHVTTYVLVTGDSDFRPLLTSMRRRGAATAIVCDAKSASEDLLALADHYQDYRDLMNDDVAAGAEPQLEEAVSLTREQGFALLAEAVTSMLQKRKIPSLGGVKIRLKLLNEEFDEERLGYPTWKSFVLDAHKAGFIAIEAKESDLVLTIPESKTKKVETLAEPFNTLLRVIAKGGGSPEGRDVSFGAISNTLKNQGMEYRTHGYNKFKKLAEAAEKRGLIELTNRGLEWYAKLTPEGAKQI